MAIEIVDFPIKNGDFPWQNVSSPEGNNQWRERPQNAAVHMFAIFSYVLLQKSLPEFTGPVVWAPCCKHFYLMCQEGLT